MSFLNPTYLWALVGLVIPVAIHLWSNKEGKTIKIGSIQFLAASDVKQSNSIKLNELLLLLLRMLIITVLVFILAEPQIKRTSKNTEITYFIEPTLLRDSSLSRLTDSLAQNSSIKLLQSGFADLSTYNEDDTKYPIPNYWQLAKEMQDLPSDSIVVFTHRYLQGFNGKRPELNRNIAWIVLGDEVETNEILEVIKKDDEIEVLKLESDQQKLSFKKEKLPLNSDAFQFNESTDSLRFITNKEQAWTPLKMMDSIAILIYYEEELEDTKLYLESSINALSKYLERPIGVVAVQDTTGIKWESYYSVVWLSENPIATTKSALIFYPDSLATSLIEPSTSNNIFHLTKPLTTKNVLDENFPEQLLKFLDLNKELEGKIQSLDRRTMDSKELSSSLVEAVSNKKTPKLISTSKWLWFLLLFLMITERICARLRKQ